MSQCEYIILFKETKVKNKTDLTVYITSIKKPPHNTCLLMVKRNIQMVE